MFEPKSTSAAAAPNPLKGIFDLSNLALVTFAFLILAVSTASSANFDVVIAPAATTGKVAVPVKSPAKRTFPFTVSVASTTPVAICEST